MRHTVALIAAAGVLFVASAVLMVLAVHWRAQDVNSRLHQQHRVELAICRSARQNRLVLRRILLLARNEVVHSPQLTPEQRRRAFRFYDRTLKIARPLRCFPHS